MKIKERAKQLETIKKVINQTEEDSARVLKKLFEIKKQEERRLIQLVGFRKEYEENQGRKKNDATISIQKMQNYRRFIAEINRAITAQQKIIRTAVNDIENQIVNWKKSRIKKDSLSMLLEQYEHEERQLEQMHEQKSLDELNQHPKYSRFSFGT